MDRELILAVAGLGCRYADAARDGPALRQEQDLVGEPRRQVYVMGDHQRGETLRIHQSACQLEQLHLMAHVERCGRLIEYEELGLLGEGARQPHALVLAAGQRP